MAAVSRNTVEAQIVGEFIDNISAQVEKMRAHVDGDMKRVKRAAKEAESGFGDLMKVIKVGVAIQAAKEITQLFVGLKNFALQHATSATNMAQQFDRSVNGLQTMIVNSKTFQSVMQSAIDTMDMVVVLATNAKAWDAFTRYIGALWDLFIEQMKNSLTSVFNFEAISAAVSGDLSRMGAAFAVGMTDSYFNDPQYKAAVDAATKAQLEWERTFAAERKNIRTSETIQEIEARQKALEDASRAEMEMALEVSRMRIEESRRVAAHEAQERAKAQAKTQVALDPKYTTLGSDLQQPERASSGLSDAQQPIDSMSSALQNLQLQLNEDLPLAVDAATGDMTVKFMAVAQVFDTVASRIGGAFDAMGAAMARGKSVFKAFGKAMAGLVADIAGMFGDLFIKQGAGLILAGNPGMGAALIAAGAALKIFAGFIAAKSGGSGGGGGSSSSAPARDYGPRQPTDGTQGGNVTYHITINGADKDGGKIAEEIIRKQDQYKRLERM